MKWEKNERVIGRSKFHGLEIILNLSQVLLGGVADFAIVADFATDFATDFAGRSETLERKEWWNKHFNPTSCAKRSILLFDLMTVSREIRVEILD